MAPAQADTFGFERYESIRVKDIAEGEEIILFVFPFPLLSFAVSHLTG